MNDFQFHPPQCANHHISMVWKVDSDFVYEEEGVRVVVRHITAFACPHGDDQAFPPQVARELYPVIRELISTAKRARAIHPTPLEYLVTA